MSRKRNETNRRYYMWCLDVFSKLRRGVEVSRKGIPDEHYSFMLWSFNDQFFSTALVQRLVLHREVEHLTTQEFIALFWEKYEKYE